MANLIYTHPADNVAPDAAWAVTSGTANSAYPLANVVDRIYAKPFKATGTAVTFTANFGSPAQEIELIGIGGQHNLVGGTVKVDNNGGMSQQTIVIPANRADGQSNSPWLDLSGVTNNNATLWTFTITGASAPVAIGEIEMYAVKRALPGFNPAYGFSDEETHPIIEHPTDFGFVKPPYDMGVTTRTLAGLNVTDTVGNIATIRDWHRACYGRVKSCLVVLDPAVNDARFVRFFESKWAHVLRYPEVHTTAFSLEEVARGPVL